MNTPLIDANVVDQVQEAIRTLNLNVNSQTLGEAAKWIGIYLIGKEIFIFLAKIALYGAIAWMVYRFFSWSVILLKTWIVESSKIKAYESKSKMRENIIEKIDWEQTKEALDVWYNEHLKKKEI